MSRRSGRSSLAAGVVALLAGCVQAAEITASWEPMTGVTYDLSPLQRHDSEPSYLITDGDIPCTDTVEKNYTYAWNLAADVTGTNIGSGCTRDAGAVQWHVDDESVCVSCGSIDDASWAMLDEDDPAAGVSITYGSGDLCHHDSSGAEVETPRTFTIELPCADVSYPSPESTYETEHCAYSASMPSFYGCPTQCPVSGRALCGGRGHCGYDNDAKSAACFCDEGYYGDACDTTTDPDAASIDTTTVAMLSTLLAFSILLMGIVAYLVRQLKLYQRDATTYMRLGSGDTDAGV